MLKDDYAQRKQKFKDNSDLMALNSNFKTIRSSLDEVKTMIGMHYMISVIPCIVHELN